MRSQTAAFSSPALPLLVWVRHWLPDPSLAADRWGGAGQPFKGAQLLIGGGGGVGGGGWPLDKRKSLLHDIHCHHANTTCWHWGLDRRWNWDSSDSPNLCIADTMRELRAPALHGRVSSYLCDHPNFVGPFLERWGGTTWTTIRNALIFMLTTVVFYYLLALTYLDGLHPLLLKPAGASPKPRQARVLCTV